MIKTNPTCGCGEDSACNEVELQCDPCCRCVPQRLCATFEAYGCGCDGVTAMLLLTGDSAYTETLVCGDSSLDLRVLLERDVYNKCYWRVLAEQATGRMPRHLRCRSLSTTNQRLLKSSGLPNAAHTERPTTCAAKLFPVC
jgi:hypothetical protein